MMKKILISSLVFFIAPFTSAETQITPTPPTAKTKLKPKDVHWDVVREPRLSGEDMKLKQTLQNNDNSTELKKIAPQNVQWSRSPKPRLSNVDLEGKSRTVITKIEADTSGRIINVEITQSSGLPNLDDILIRAIKVSRFKPYRENGVRHPIQVIQAFAFSSDHNGPSSKSSQQNNSPTKVLCSYNFNSEVLKQ